jgi:hypothetical protein
MAAAKGVVADGANNLQPYTKTRKLKEASDWNAFCLFTSL